MMRLMGLRWRGGWLGLVALLAAVSCGVREPRAFGAGQETSERWYVLQMQGERAGWMRERETTGEHGYRKAEQQMVMKLDRFGQSIEVSMTMGTVERAGKLIEMSREQLMGQETQRWVYRFGDNGVKEVSETAAATTTKTLPLPEGDWLTPSEVEALVQEKLESGAKSFSYETLDVTSGLQVVTMTQEVVGPTNVEVMGKTVPGVKWEVTNSLVPGMQTTEWVNADGRVLRSTIDMGGMVMNILESEKEFALSDFAVPELMGKTVVRPRGVIENPRQTRRASYIVSMDSGRDPTLAEGGAQRVERLGNGRARVMVDVGSPRQATPEEIANAEYLEPSATVGSEDPCIVGLMERATAGLGEDALAEERARAMEVFVRDYISEKNLGVGFATASEVCSTREGDCSEHAVLLAAMLRAGGIPSRAVSGVVYVDQFGGNRNVFGFHMWVQALLEIDGAKRWVDLDAAVYPMDATHIAITTSTLSDKDIVNSMVSVAGMLSGLRIKVEEVE